MRAVALSGLVTIFSKHYTGRLSALCGCVLGGGSGGEDAAAQAFLQALEDRAAPEGEVTGDR